METEVIARFKNADGDLESRVTRRADGYGVVLFDLDSGNAVPVVNIYPDLDAATAAARKAVAD